MSKPILNLSRYSNIVYTDGTTQTTDTMPTLSALSGQINENQMPTSIGSGTTLQLLDVGTF